MIPAIKLVGALMGLVALQQLGASVMPETFRPDFVLVFALALGLRRNALSSLVLAFGMGVVVDVLSGAPTGTYALLRGTACAATRAADRSLYLRAPLPWGLYAAAYQAVDLLLLLAIGLLLLPEGATTWGGILGRVPGTAVATGLVSVPVCAWLRRWGLADSQETTSRSLSPRRAMT